MWKDVDNWNLKSSYNLPSLQPVVSMQFLGDEETVKKAIESVANQGKAK